MEKIQLAIDLDGVVINIMQAIVNRYNESQKEENQLYYWNLTTWDVDNLLNVSKDTLYHWIEEIDPKDVMVDMNVAFVIRTLICSEKYLVKFLTKKNDKMMVWTNEVLNQTVLSQMNIPIEFVPESDEKSNPKYKWDILIDDNYDCIKKCSQVNRKAILFVQPWNICKAKIDNTPIMYSWNLVEHFLLEEIYTLWGLKFGLFSKK